ncbi:hypothetical protein [Hufsiella ginkgonis]|uniref:DUF1761 family protein n=1 Tax=Hufsiella ginkgonis TaxID=2695274 RepID=A0A7K1XYZ7_9SPHI|nr:hypothetical protein [Hufsiella ginkgonis]MXV16224.1 hypothetical protein [Hufsiella ginkgonis]
MSLQKFLLSGTAGGVANFFMGFLIYGFLLSKYFMDTAGTATNVYRADNDMLFWALILGSLFSGFLLAFIFGKYGSVRTFGAGALGGFVIYVLMAASHDFTMLGTTNISTLQGTLMDLPAAGVMGAVTGGVVGLVNGLFTKKTGA